MELCTVLLMDDSKYPCWLVLVPQRKDIKVHARCILPPPAVLFPMLSRRITDVDIEKGDGAHYLSLRDGWIVSFDSILTWGLPMISSEMPGLY